MRVFPLTKRTSNHHVAKHLPRLAGYMLCNPIQFDRTDGDLNGYLRTKIFNSSALLDHLGFFPRRLQSLERFWLRVPTVDFSSGRGNPAPKSNFRQTVAVIHQ